MNLSLTKNELRTLYKAKEWPYRKMRSIFCPKTAENFILQFNPIENQNVNIFLSIEKFNEVNTQIFIDYFFDSRMRVFVPKIQGEKSSLLRFFPILNLKLVVVESKNPFLTSLQT